MRLDLDKLAMHVAHIELSIGRIFIYALRIKDVAAFSKLPANASALDKARAAFIATASRSAFDSKDNRTPERLTPTEVAGLSTDDSSQLAMGLLDEKTFSKIWSASPERLATYSAKLESESPIEQLSKTVDWIVQCQRGDSQKLVETIEKSAWGQLQSSVESFRKSQVPIQAQIDAISRQYKHFADIGSSDFNPQPSASYLNSKSMQRITADIDEAANVRRAENAKKLSHLEATANASVATMVAMGNVSSNVAKILADFSNASEKADSSQRRSMLVAIYTFMAGLLVSAIGCYFAVASYNQDKENNQSNDKWQERVESAVKQQIVAAQELTELRAKHELLRQKIHTLELQLNKPVSRGKSSVQARPD